MINEEWNRTQNDAPFVAFYDMHAVTFVLPDEMADVSIMGLQWFILIPGLNYQSLVCAICMKVPFPFFSRSVGLPLSIQKRHGFDLLLTLDPLLNGKILD